MIKPEGCTGLFKVRDYSDNEDIIYAVIGMYVMYYDPDFDEWVASAMNRIELEQLSALGLASVGKINEA